MKKIYLAVLGTFMFSGLAIAQSSVIVTNLSNNQIVPDGGIVYEGILANGTSQIDFNIKNTSAATKVYKLKRFDDVLNTGGSAYFCFTGTCYPPTTITSPVSLTLTAGQDASSISLPMQLHYDEASTVGTSEIRYQLYDATNINDIMTFTIKYNNPLSVKSLQKTLTMSGVYPNPVSAKAQFTLYSANDLSVAEINLTNSLGATVLTKQLSLSQGNNSVVLDCDGFNSGIYFISVKQGATTLTKKIIINN